MDGDIRYKGSRVSITNIMAKMRCAPFDLSQVAVKSGGKHHKDKYSSVSIKLSCCHCNLYCTGVVILMGCPSLASVTQSIHQLAKVLEEHYSPVDVNPVIVNMATRFSLRITKDDLNSFCARYKDDVISCMYEPELSNGVHFSLDFFSRVILHQTGKGIITGVKSADEAYGVLELMHDMICE